MYTIHTYLSTYKYKTRSTYIDALLQSDRIKNKLSYSEKLDDFFNSFCWLRDKLFKIGNNFTNQMFSESRILCTNISIDWNNKISWKLKKKKQKKIKINN